MRKLMWFTVGFGGACLTCSYLLWEQNLFGISLIVAVAAMAAAIAVLKVKQLSIPALILLGCAVGLAWFGGIQRYYILPAAELDGETGFYTVTAGNYSERSLYGTSVDGTVTLDGRTYQIRVYLKGEQQVQPGDRLNANFRIRLTTPGGMKESTYYQGKGIFLLGSQTGELEIVESQKKELRFFPARLSKEVKDILQMCMPEDVYPFAQALLLGDSSELDYETSAAFSISGIRHIIAVSGLHVIILYGLIVLLTGNQRYLTALVGLPVLLIFAAMAGFTPSVSRAAIMVCLMMLAGVLDRDYDTPTELAFACLILMLINPFIVTSVSFQLSVSSVVGLLTFSQRIQKTLAMLLGNPKQRWAHWLLGTVGITLGAAVSSTPLTAYYFHTVSLVSPVTNLLTVWIISFVFYGILLVCAVGSVHVSMGMLLGQIAAWPMRYVLKTAVLLGRIPYAAVYTESKWIVGWIAVCYLLFVIRVVLKKGRIRILLAIGMGTLCCAVFLSWYLPRQDSCRMTVLDVGQGQSILLRSKGSSFLVDCGGYSDTTAADRAAQTLLSEGVFALDGMMVTHYDKDHIGGIPYLLTRVRVKNLYLPLPADEEFVAELSEKSDAVIHWIENEDQLFLGASTITFLDSKSGKSANENCAGILFETADCGILVTGDRNKSGERALLKAARIPDVDVLIAGHHGSKNSTAEELLDAVKPEIVMISVGAGNSYGHPAPELLDRLAAHGCTVYRTDEMGSITYRR